MTYPRKAFLVVGIILTIVGIGIFLTTLDRLFADQDMIKGFIGNMIGIGAGIALILRNLKPTNEEQYSSEVKP